MPLRRWLLLATCFAVSVGAAGVALWPTEPRPRLATFEKVRVGMTREEVAAVVGGPPGLYKNGALVEDLAGFGGGPDCDSWMSLDGELVVRFGPDGRAVTVETMALPERGLWDRLRRRIGL